MTGQENEGVESAPMTSGPVFIALSSLRNTEARLRWQGAQWVIALNVTAFVALMYRVLSTAETLEFFILAVGCAIIAALDFEWYNVLRRDGRLFNFWNKKIIEHERANGIEGGVQVFISPEYERLSSSRDRLQRTLERLTVWFIYGWAIAAIVLSTWLAASWKGDV